MKTTTVSATGVGGHAGAVGRRALAGDTVGLIGTLVFNAALLLAGVRLTGFAWQDVCFLLLPPMVASAGSLIWRVVGATNLGQGSQGDQVCHISVVGQRH